MTRTVPAAPGGRAARALLLAGLLAVVVVAVLLVRGGGSSATHRILLPDAGQLVDGNEVQVGGRRVGLVTGIELTDGYRAEVRFEVTDEDLLPLHEGTTAAVRVVSMSGMANRVVSLTPGPSSAPELQDGAALPVDAVTTPVELDQFFDVFQPRTREGLRRIFRGGSRTLAGRERDANVALRRLAPALGSGRRLFAELAGDGEALERLLRSGSRTVGALARERQSLTSAVSHLRTTSAALADEGAALEQTLDRLPGTFSRVRATFGEVRTTLDRLDPLVAASKPAARDGLPLLRELRPMAAELVPTVRDASRLARGPRSGDDLLELLASLRPLARAGVPALEAARRSSNASRPVAAFVRPYAPEITGWFRTFSGATAIYDANGHVARTQGVLNLNSPTDLPTALAPIRSLLQLTAPLLGLHHTTPTKVRRCPGANFQTLPDRSNRYRDGGTLDCDPEAVVPGG
jgi:phospholipid/cholesterol/gamma-HCH transport system substrate-binding protein